MSEVVAENQEQEVIRDEAFFNELVRGTEFDLGDNAPATQTQEAAPQAQTKPTFESAPGTDTAPVRVYEIGAHGIKARPASEQEIRRHQKLTGQGGKEQGAASAAQENGKLDEALSPARRLLLKYNSKPFEPERIDFEDQTFFAQRLDSGGHSALSILLGRVNGVLDFTSVDSQRSFNSACISVGITVDKAGQIPAFEPSEAWEMATSQAMEICDLVDKLVGAFMRANHDAFKLEQSSDKEVKELEKKDVSDG